MIQATLQAQGRRLGQLLPGQVGAESRPGAERFAATIADVGTVSANKFEVPVVSKVFGHSICFLSAGPGRYTGFC